MTNSPARGAATPGLRRTMKSTGALMITLSGLSPTIGVFIVGSDIVRQAGTGAFLCFAAAALLGLAMAFVYAELVSAFPETGAEYTIMARALGSAWGFVALGLNLVNFTVAQALSGLGVATYLEGVAPGLPPILVAVVLVATVTVVAVLNIRLNALLTGVFLLLEVASLVALSALGFLHPHRGLVEVLLRPQALGGGGVLVAASLGTLGTAAAGAVYAFDGYGGVVSLGEEIVDASRRVAGVVFWSLGLAIVLQLTPMLAVTLGAPDPARLFGSPAPLPAFVSAVAGHTLGTVLSVAVAVAIFNAMIALSLMAARQLYATGRDQVWTPGLNRAFSRLHHRFHSPWIASLAMGVASLLWCAASLSFLVTVIASVTVATYVGLCLAVINGRRGGSTRRGAFRMPLFPLAPGLALVGLAAVVWSSAWDPQIGRPGLVAAAVVILVSLLLYKTASRAGGAWRDRGPGAPDARCAERSARR